MEGTENEELVHGGPESSIPTSISPDGRWLLFRQDADIWLLALDGSAEPRPLIEGPTFESGGRFSPDGRWITFGSRESGRREVYAMPFPGPGRRYQITTEGGGGGRWRNDGREILFQAQGTLYAVGVEPTGSSLRIGSPQKLFSLEGITAGAPLPDFSRFITAVSKRSPEVAPLALVMNWTAELERK